MDTSYASPFRVAVAQMNPVQGDWEHNSRTIIEKHMPTAYQNNTQMIVFPECALSGYVYNSVEEAMPASLPADGPATAMFVEGCRQYNLFAVIGFLERDLKTDTIYNSALVVGPEGLVACYRKCHLPVLGVDRYVGRGDELPIIELPFARIGILICYDMRFPEAARSLALRGADVLVLPTNWPEGAESAPEFLTRARAWENRMYVVACNRVGVERGTRFIGRSQVVAPDGTFLAQADGISETLFYADIDPMQARRKKVVFEPGVFELDPVGGRRPELYGDLTTTEPS